MPQAPSKKSDAAWAALFQIELANRETRPTGDNWKTMEEICRGMKAGPMRAHKFMRQMLDEGRAEQFRGYILKDNRLVRAWWYRPIVLKLSEPKSNKRK